jgi:hypothetical protein
LFVGNVVPLVVRESRVVPGGSRVLRIAVVAVTAVAHDLVDVLDEVRGVGRSTSATSSGSEPSSLIVSEHLTDIVEQLVNRLLSLVEFFGGHWSAVCCHGQS